MMVSLNNRNAITIISSLNIQFSVHFIIVITQIRHIKLVMGYQNDLSSQEISVRTRFESLGDINSACMPALSNVDVSRFNVSFLIPQMFFCALICCSVLSFFGSAPSFLVLSHLFGIHSHIFSPQPQLCLWSGLGLPKMPESSEKANECNYSEAYNANLL